MGTFQNRNKQQIRTFQREDGTWFTPNVPCKLFLEVEFFENRTEIWIAKFDNVGRELQRWNMSFVRSFTWEN